MSVAGKEPRVRVSVLLECSVAGKEPRVRMSLLFIDECSRCRKQSQGEFTVCNVV